MVTIILHYPHCGSQARVTPRAFPQWQTEGSLSCLQPPQPRESDSHCLSRSAPRGDRECLPRTRASCAASPVRSGSLGPPEPGGSKKGAQLPPLRTTLLAPDPQESTSTALELDELCSLVLKKAHDSWMWIALCRKSRQVVASAVGDRSRQDVPTNCATSG